MKRVLVLAAVQEHAITHASREFCLRAGFITGLVYRAAN